MRTIVPDCEVELKTGTSRMKDKIEEMVDDDEIPVASEGWKKLTDMLRASYSCERPQELLDTLAALESSERVRIARIQPRLRQKEESHSNEGHNDVTINFEYQG